MTDDIDKVSLNINSTGFEALEALQTGGLQIVLILDDNKKLVGTISDGDLRRIILLGKPLDTNVSLIMNQNFISCKEKETKLNILSLMQKHFINQLPVIDNFGKVVKIHLLHELINLPNKFDNNVIIMAGGVGSRLRPYTANCPKPMLKIGGKPILEILLEQSIKAGFKNFYFSVNYLKEKIIDYFKDGSEWDVNINYLIEKNPLGTAGSLSLLPNNIDKPFLVMNGDILTNLSMEKLLDFHLKNKSDATICAREYKEIIPYGVIEVDGINFLDLKEKPTHNFLVNAGVYILNPSLLKEIKKNEFIDMPEILLRAKNMDKKVSVFPIHENWLDIGLPKTFELAREEWGKE